MNGMIRWIFVGVVLVVMTSGALYDARADHDEYEKERGYQKIFDWDNDGDHERGKKRRRYQKRNRNNSMHNGKRCLTPANNPTYIKECGDCLFSYQPQLLPSGSWEKIIAGCDDHFKEELEIDTDSKSDILGYLIANSAEKSSAKIAIKIMKSLGNRTPVRITEVPYILKKHHEVNPAVLKKDSIGSPSNCPACHTKAEKGIYEDDHVVIPQ